MSAPPPRPQNARLALRRVPSIGIALWLCASIVAPAVAEERSGGELTAGEADADNVQSLKWNELEGPLTTMRLGFGLLFDGAFYSQDAVARGQVEFDPGVAMRDFRILANGKIKPTKGLVSWTVGIMYEELDKSWVLRQTGFMIHLPANWGHLFIGRTKEGISMNKIMVGYTIWTMERATFNEATIPILADGVKWQGFLPDVGLLWNLGYFNDFISKGQAFSTYEQQVIARLGWLPLRTNLEQTLLHLAAAVRYGIPLDRELQLRSRPESVPGATYVIDTGKFQARDSRMLSLEAYFRSGPFQFGAEYFFLAINSPQTGDPLFHGGEAFFAWLLTGEARPYKAEGGYFLAVAPSRSILKGGFGAVEAVVRFSYSDLDGGSVRGGRFWRVTPMVNWYLTSSVRLEFVYGYGELDRFGVEGATQFLQSRVQFSL